MENFNFEKEKFNNPEEEISFLKNYISNREKEIAANKKEKNPQNLENSEREKVAQEVLDEYKENTPEDMLNKGTVIPEKMRDEIVLKLSPETHDDKMSELIELVYSKGVSNVIDIVTKMENPHITDDFHRFLVQYLKSGYPLNGLKENTPLSKNLKRNLFEVTLSYADKNEEIELQSFLSWMEQFYSGMISVTDTDKNEYISLELSNSIGSKEFIFYISVPNGKSELLEKQLLSVFPNASLEIKPDDFNVFYTDGFSKGVYIKQKNNPSQVIKTFDKFVNDPMKVMLNVFSKLDKDSESASIQLIFKPVGDFYIKNYKKGLSRLEKGEKNPDELFVRNTFGSKLSSGISKMIGPKAKKPEGEKIETEEEKIENVKSKIETNIVSTNWRVVVSAPNNDRASTILNDIQSAFNQFENTNGNKFEFVEVLDKHKKDFFKKFSFREFDQNYDTPLNLKEVATVMHLPFEGGNNSPELKTNNMKTSPASLKISDSGLFMGQNSHRGSNTDVYFAPEDRLRHFYTIGQTGTGKTNMLKQMIIQDIHNGEGVCMIDPHGSDIQDVLANIPEERYEDVIYFDPSHIDRPLALNMLEYDVSKPQQKTFVVNELFSIFQKLYGANPESMGPMFEQYFRNATMLVIEDPESGSTLLDVSRVLSDKKFRDMKISRCKNPVVVQFWQEIAGKAGGEAALENIVPYITSKFDVFLANDVMRPIMAQQKSSFDFRQIMDEKKILLVNLSKGSLGDINSNLIGLILVGKILMAALSRSDSADRNYPPFYLYIDEFQNVTTNSISTILSEARKYKLSLNVAHQYIAQLDEKIKDSIFGNVGSMSVFRVGSEDAEFLENQFGPTFTAKDIMNIDNYNCYIKMLANGVPVEPFSLKVAKAPDGNPEIIESLKKLSYMKYGKDREEVEREIMSRYQKPQTEPKSKPKENDGYNDLKSLNN
jgi:hypothetical protein